MKTLLLCVVVCFIGVCAGLPPQPPKPNPRPEIIQPQHAHLLGAKECTWGPSYWCKNLTTAAGCHATKHCIQTVWVHQKLPPDHSSVCDTCLEMVKEARDQLLSNETQEEIKEVFEGSCKLLPVKVISNECCKLADEFIPELVDTLASQMNPQVVCSVAGLCNNERVHRLIGGAQGEASELQPKFTSDRCEGCHTVVGLVEKKFEKSDRDQVLQSFLQICGGMGSLSDACSNIIVTYFNDIYKHLEENLNPNDFCLMAGECSAMFHTHANVEITPLSKVGVVPIGEHDDLPCDLCEQLVKHLQDILVANTTENEFHQVLQGICKETKSFKDECLSIVDQYYPLIYGFLVNELNGSVVCSMIGICPPPALMEIDNSSPIVPLLPYETAQNPLLSARPIVPIGRVGVSKPGSSVQILQTPELAQLPIERLMPQTLTIIGDTKLCVFCEYFLHYVQQAMTDPVTENKIKEIVDKACDRLPQTINGTCRQFVDTYGPAFIAILAQDIDPSTVCPTLSICPSQEARHVEIFMHRNRGEKPNCPMCLFAITSLEEYIKNKRTEENIRKALGTLCSHLSDNLQEECNDFVETYTNEIVEACIAQLNPQEICVYLKICEDKTPPRSLIPPVQYGGQVSTNEIPDRTAFGKIMPKKIKSSPVCVLCEFVMSQLEQELKNNATEDEIKTAVHNICNHLPKSVRKECNGFVDQYADVVIQLLIESLDPTQVCAELKLCDQKRNHYLDVNNLMNIETFGPLPTEEHVNSPQCSLCKIVMTQIENMLQGRVNEADIIKAVHGVCNVLPKHQSKECNDFINKNGDKIIELLKLAIQPSEICSLMFFCSSDFNMVRLDVRKCSVCEAAVDIMDKVLENPHVDHALEHVLEKTCRALPRKDEPLCRNMIDTYGEQLFKMLSHAANPGTVCSEIGMCVARFTRPPRDTLVGANKCTWGPGYWCLSEDNANGCGPGAVQHCQTKVWNQSSTPKS